MGIHPGPPVAGHLLPVSPTLCRWVALTRKSSSLSKICFCFVILVSDHDQLPGVTSISTSCCAPQSRRGRCHSAPEPSLQVTKSKPLGACFTCLRCRCPHCSDLHVSDHHQGPPGRQPDTQKAQTRADPGQPRLPLRAASCISPHCLLAPQV